jgi:anaerobic ribonucleoside-triphosphate reductase
MQLMDSGSAGWTGMIERIRKRDGRVVEFQTEKIALAISKAFRAVGREE